MIGSRTRWCGPRGTITKAIATALAVLCALALFAGAAAAEEQARSDAVPKLDRVVATAAAVPAARTCAQPQVKFQY